MTGSQRRLPADQGLRTGSPRWAGCGEDFRGLASSVKGCKVAGKLTHPHHDLPHRLAQRGEPTQRVGVLAAGLGVSGIHGTAGPLTSPASGQVPQPCPMDHALHGECSQVCGGRAWPPSITLRGSTPPPRIGPPSACVSLPRVCPFSLGVSPWVRPLSLCLFTLGPSSQRVSLTPGPFPQPASLTPGPFSSLSTGLSPGCGDPCGCQ